MNSSNWADNTSPSLGQAIAEDPIVVVPVGSIEQHGNHLPVGTDGFAVEAVARRAVESWQGRRKVFLLPTLWTGLSPHHMNLPGTITLRSETFISVLEDICISLLHHGVRRILLLNGHGGNISAMDVALARLGERKLETERVVALTYWHLVASRAAEMRESRVGGTGHAGEFETSLMLATQPDQVKLDEAQVAYPELPSGYLSTDLFEGAPARRYIPFDKLSSSGTFGDPSLATLEKGERILRVCSEELLAFLHDFQAW
ncbi:MAG TPA: creatininase family protein [Trueperaceae bacterium]